MERVVESLTEACESALLYPTRIVVEVIVKGAPPLE